MRTLDPELRIKSSAGPIDRARPDTPGDQRGDEHVPPVPSDATGVRDGGGRGRADATRPRRRYITAEISSPAQGVWRRFSTPRTPSTAPASLTSFLICSGRLTSPRR
jgi:hypothetical protein